jgi:catechol 2,3-dioxygenase-like lactoylglutathione lyase family enzyme
MYSHNVVGSNDLDRSQTFYDAVFGAVGGQPGMRDPSGGRIIYNYNDGMFMVTAPINGAPATSGNGCTIGFGFGSSDEVNAWHAAGVANGGTSIENPPGIRPMPFGDLYLAYLRDPDGNKLCGLYAVPQQ